jgi:hypothetical protein
MLMVAATFPVGLDQARIVSEQTVAPLVADEAFATLHMLLNTKSNERRIGNDIPPVSPTLSFRDTFIMDSPFYLINGPLSDRLNNRDPDGILINDWLVAPYDTTGGANPQYGAQTRYYPSVPGTPNGPYRNSSFIAGATPPNLQPLYTWTIPQGPNETVEPSYTWSTLYRKTSTGGGLCVQFVVFVNRRSWQTPVQIYLFTDIAYNPQTPLNARVKYPVGQTLPLPEGGYLVRYDGVIYQVKSNEFLSSDSQYQYYLLSLNRNPLDNQAYPGSVSDPLNPPFWFMPAEPNTGRSPCIGVYRRTFSLN